MTVLLVLVWATLAASVALCVRLARRVPPPIDGETSRRPIR
jgi:hypothetical protein